MLENILDMLNFQFASGLHGPMLWIGLAMLGLTVGTITGLFGVGGGFMVTPLLNIIFGVRYELAVGSDLCFIVGTSTAGLRRHGRLGNVEPKTILCIASGSMVGAVLGDVLQQYIITEIANGEVKQFTEIMHCLFIAILLLTAWLVWRGPGVKPEGHRTPLQRLKIGPHVDLKAAGLTGVSLPGLMGIGLAVGVLTGLLGVGGGVLFMPVLILLVGLNAHQAVGTSLGVVLLAALVATAKKGWADNVSLGISAALLVTSGLGVQIGAWLCMKIHGERLRKYFALIVLAAVGMVIYDLVRSLTGGEAHAH
jgi:uncharacterized protein